MGESATRNMAEYFPPSRQKSQSLIDPQSLKIPDLYHTLVRLWWPAISIPQHPGLARNQMQFIPGRFHAHLSPPEIMD